MHVGDKVRVIANQLVGRNTNYDETKIIAEETNFNPTWTINSYNAEFVYNNSVIAEAMTQLRTEVHICGRIFYQFIMYVRKTYRHENHGRYVFFS